MEQEKLEYTAFILGVKIRCNEPRKKFYDFIEKHNLSGISNAFIPNHLKQEYNSLFNDDVKNGRSKIDESS